MAHPSVDWAHIVDAGWDIVLASSAWPDIANARTTCKSWKRDVDRCLQRLHLRDPTPDSLGRLGSTFLCLSTVKITAVKEGIARLENVELKGAFGRLGALGLRSKVPGGAPLAVGQLQILRTAGPALTRLSLRACDVVSWKGLETCHRLVQLDVIHCRLSSEAALGFTSALASLSRLAALDVRCCGAAARRRAGSGAGGGNGQQPSAPLSLEGLGAGAPRLTSLRLVAPLSDVRLRRLLEVELRGMPNLLELELEVQGCRVSSGGHREHPPPAGQTQGPARELETIIPAVAAAAPLLTSLRIKGHSMLGDRDLEALAPLCHLRRLQLDLPPLDPDAQAHRLLQAFGGAAAAAAAATADGSDRHPSDVLTCAGVCALLRVAPQLEELSLAHAEWSPAGLRALGASTSLRQLRLHGVSDLPKEYTLCAFLHGLRSLPHLVELDLSDCTSLSDWGLALLGRRAASLAHLSVRGCGGGGLVSDVGVGALAPLMRRLKHLDLSFLDGLTDRGIARLMQSPAPALQTLSISYCERVTDAGVQAIAAACPALRHLSLDHCVGVGAAGASALRGARELRRVSAEGCPSILAALSGTPAARPKRCRATALAGGRPNETPQDQLERRRRESAEVETRVHLVDTEEEFVQVLEDAGDKLVVVEVQQEGVCQTGIDDPEPEIHWKLDAEKAREQQLAKCTAVKHVIQRTARECPDVSFVAIETDGSTERDALVRKLGVQVLPTLQFYRNGKLLWEHKGVGQMEAGVGEGVMYYGDAGAGGVQPSSVVAEITSKAKLQEFLSASTDPNVLQVLNVSLTSAGPCIKVFPAVVALSRSFQGYATFARLLGDQNGDTRELLQSLNIVEVPTFIFFRSGKEVGRHVGSSRGDLIGQILQQQAAVGLSPPAPPVTAKRSRAVGRGRK
ncbi:hypothetical protein GPECTOR_23g5 [Gonium pectorale]|uniref:F-box/LRR-repeat protein 15-like leucin rich repeat domain-containing protein n=1 Tax=Gonium pectorale TaxID=33097 RepID=A0A150GIC2_GONPE|nr:hypothetical protein GPECTOR_23g5 [Gonium pectorale]|eukprot:KXZ49120.1 hypothetical protein GPECTOR_23g5 [Gonium pectorale]